MKHRPQIVAFMTPFPYSIDIDAPLSEARAFMQRRRIRHLPVTSRGTVVGLITDRDIKLVLGPDFAYPPEKELKVSDVCVEDPYIVPASTPVAVVAGTMAKRHIGSAVITKKAKLVGVFTSTDACRALAKLLGPTDEGGPGSRRSMRQRRTKRLFPRGAILGRDLSQVEPAPPGGRNRRLGLRRDPKAPQTSNLAGGRK